MISSCVAPRNESASDILEVWGRLESFSILEKINVQSGLDHPARSQLIRARDGANSKLAMRRGDEVALCRRA